MDKRTLPIHRPELLKQSGQKNSILSFSHQIVLLMYRRKLARRNQKAYHQRDKAQNMAKGLEARYQARSAYIFDG